MDSSGDHTELAKIASTSDPLKRKPSFSEIANRQIQSREASPSRPGQVTCGDNPSVSLSQGKGERGNAINEVIKDSTNVEIEENKINHDLGVEDHDLERGNARKEILKNKWDKWQIDQDKQYYNLTEILATKLGVKLDNPDELDKPDRFVHQTLNLFQEIRTALRDAGTIIADQMLELDTRLHNFEPSIRARWTESAVIDLENFWGKWEEQLEKRLADRTGTFVETHNNIMRDIANAKDSMLNNLEEGTRKELLESDPLQFSESVALFLQRNRATDGSNELLSKTVIDKNPYFRSVEIPKLSVDDLALFPRRVTNVLDGDGLSERINQIIEKSESDIKNRILDLLKSFGEENLTLETISHRGARHSLGWITKYELENAKNTSKQIGEIMTRTLIKDYTMKGRRTVIDAATTLVANQWTGIILVIATVVPIVLASKKKSS